MEVLNAEERELLKLIFKNPLGRGGLENGQLGDFVNVVMSFRIP